MQRARSFLSYGAAMFCMSSIAHASVNHIELPINDSGAHWQAISSHDAGVIWLGSSDGHIARSDDAGESWNITRPAGSTALPISQIKAIDDRQAFALTYGQGTDSRLYHTRNGGFSWNRVYRANGNERLRCFDLIPDGEAWVLADGLNDNWHVVRSTNGRRWLDSRSGFDTRLQTGEGAFSDSGSCVRYDNNAWVMATAYASPARIAVKSTTALRFNVHNTPFTGANPAVTAAFPLSTSDILIAGGDLDDTEIEPTIYRWRNREFETVNAPALDGLLTNLTVFNDALVVANQSGTAWSGDWGESWEMLDIPALQMSCSTGSGCMGLSREGIHQFTPGN